VEDVFTAVGWAHGVDRLWQIFIRFSTANGRLSEFLGRGQNDANLESDILAYKLMYNEEEINNQFKLFSDNGKLAYQGYLKGLLTRYSCGYNYIMVLI
jgi:acyl-homoserine lactone acylase PvdQ